jgi:cytochrome c oxidase cbb3-type subunit IV
MDAYSTLRHFADSWGLLAMTLAFLGASLYVFRPGARSLHRDSAAIPFRHEDAPAPLPPPAPAPIIDDDRCTGCGQCGGRCNTLSARLEP